jgi:putative peptidoglycan lipid II flippase
LLNGVYRPQAGWRAFATQVGLAAAGMGVGLSVAANHLTGWVGWSVLERGGCLALLVTGGAMLYVSLAWVAGLRLMHMAQPEPRL